MPTFNGRTREGALLRGVRAELLAYIGGRPTTAQSLLIESIAQLRLRIAMMDRKVARDGVQTDHDSRTYLAWVSTLGRQVQRLDSLKHKAAPAADLSALLDSITAGRRTAASAVDDDGGSDDADSDDTALAAIVDGVAP